MKTAKIFVQSRVPPSSRVTASIWKTIIGNQQPRQAIRARHFAGFAWSIFSTPQKNILSNQDIVQKRLEVAKAKKELMQFAKEGAALASKLEKKVDDNGAPEAIGAEKPNPETSGKEDGATPTIESPADGGVAETPQAFAETQEQTSPMTLPVNG